MSVLERLLAGVLPPGDEAAWRTGSPLVLGLYGGTWTRLRKRAVLILGYQGAAVGPVHARQKSGKMLAEAIAPLVLPVPAGVWFASASLFRRREPTVLLTKPIAPIDAWLAYGEGVEVVPLKRPPKLGEPPPVEEPRGDLLPLIWTVGATSR